jgi:hypothetical protein
LLLTFRSYFSPSLDVPLTWQSFSGLFLGRLLPLAILASLGPASAPPTALENPSDAIITLLVASALLFAPILETLVFVVVFAVLEELRWEILDTPIKRRVVCACLAVLFGLVHFREAFQTAVVTMAGYVFIRILIEQRREGMMRQGYWWSVLAHSCYNATVISIMLLSPS